MVLLVGCSFRVAGSSDAPPLIDDASATIDAPLDGPPGIDAMIDAPIDGPPTAVCSGAGLICPGGTLPRAITCSTGCWYGCRDGTSVTQVQASTLCTTWGGKLARIDSAAEETCMRTVIDGAIWIGLQQALNQTNDAAGWSWNGDAIMPPYLRWASGQPNDGDGTESNVEQCAYSSTSTTWQDELCTATLTRFTCRK